MNNKAKHLTTCAIFAKEQVCRGRLHAGIQGRVKPLISEVNNHCDLTLTTWRGECCIRPAEAIITGTEGTAKSHSLKSPQLVASLRKCDE